MFFFLLSVVILIVVMLSAAMLIIVMRIAAISDGCNAEFCSVIDVMLIAKWCCSDCYYAEYRWTKFD